MGRQTSYSDLRQNLARHMDAVLESNAPLTVTRQGKGDVVLISADEFASMEETLHLLRSPANARRLLRSIRSADAGRTVERGLMEARGPARARRGAHRTPRPGDAGTMAGSVKDRTPG